MSNKPTYCATREAHRFHANTHNYFWLPCNWPECGRYFGGHEQHSRLPTNVPGIGILCCDLHINEPLPNGYIDDDTMTFYFYD